jgi:hypothetical protein
MGSSEIDDENARKFVAAIEERAKTIRSGDLLQYVSLSRASLVRLCELAKVALRPDEA